MAAAAGSGSGCVVPQPVRATPEVSSLCRSRESWIPSSPASSASRTAYTLDSYLKHRGYDGLRKALGDDARRGHRDRQESGLRGRGGAGFPTGMKWQFVDKKSPNPKYICCNADESEPGTFKDHVLMERNPHLLLEGCAIGCYAIGASVAYIYIRGEFLHVQQVLEARSRRRTRRAISARTSSAPGSTAMSFVHRGAGAYEAGEETALHRVARGQARAAAPQAAVPRGRRASMAARPPSTTSRRSATCRRSS